MQPRHHGPDGAAKHLGNLAVRQPFDVTEHDNGSGFGRQGIERLPDPLALLRLDGHLVGSPARIRRGAPPFLLGHPFGAERTGLRSARALPIRGDIDRDAEQPRVERRLAAE